MKTYYGNDFSIIGTCLGIAVGAQTSSIFGYTMFEILHKNHSPLFIFLLTLPFTTTTVVSYAEIYNFIGIQLEIY